MKAVLLAAALMLTATQAHASWAEGANKQNPVFTGTNASLARAEASEHYHYRHFVRHHHRYER